MKRALFAILIIAWAPIQADIWSLPPGQWKIKDGELRLRVTRGNYLLFYSPRASTIQRAEVEVQSLVRREYWVTIKEVRDFERRIPGQESQNTPTAAEQDADISAIESQQAGSNDESGPDTQTLQPLNLEWLTLRSRLVLTYQDRNLLLTIFYENRLRHQLLFETSQ